MIETTGSNRVKKRIGLTAAVFIATVLMYVSPVLAEGVWTPEENLIYMVKDQPYSEEMAYEGAFKYSCDADALPSGLTFDETTGKIEGTVSQPGDSTVICNAYNESGEIIGTKEYTLRVTDVPYHKLTVSVNDAAMGQIDTGSPDGYLPEGLVMPIDVKAGVGYIIDTVMLNGTPAGDLSPESKVYHAELSISGPQEIYVVFKEETAAVPAGSVSENSVSVSENSVLEEPKAMDVYQMQTLNYKQEVLTDWQQILPALKTLSPADIVNPDQENKMLMLQLQNVKSIPSQLKESITNTDGSEYTKVFQCNLGYGASIVFYGSSDNSNFKGINNLNVSINSQPRGKKSVETSVTFESHEDFGTVAGLQVNLPDCKKGTKVSVYAEKMTGGTMGENVCIGTTKADEQGNVEVPIQTTANYLFLYKK